MILLSAHKDVVKFPFPLEYKNGVHSGLMDNFIGILATYLAIYANASIAHLEKKGELRIFHSNHEEFGLDIDLPKLDRKKDTVVVVDVCSGPQYKGKDFAIENVYGIPMECQRVLQENLRWEGFTFDFRRFTGNPDDEDEAFKWKERKQPVLSFIIPIDGENWHGTTSIPQERLARAVDGLVRLLCYIV